MNKLITFLRIIFVFTFILSCIVDNGDNSSDSLEEKPPLNISSTQNDNAEIIQEEDEYDAVNESSPNENSTTQDEAENPVNTTANEIIKIAIYGDSRTNHDVHKDIVNNILTFEPSAVFHTGDLVNDGNNVSDWDAFNGITTDMINNSKFYPVLGNHENNSKLYYDNFILPNNEEWYSVDIGSLHLVVLDSNMDIGLLSNQYKWLESDLTHPDNSIKFVIVIFHHPILTTSKHSSDEKNFLQDVIPLLELYNVKVIFSGHNHCYEHFFYNDVHYVVTGGGGAPLYDQKSSSPYLKLFVKDYNFCIIESEGYVLTVTVYDITKTIIDYFEIEP